MTDITKHLVFADTDHLELANFLAGLGSSQREPRNVLEGPTTFYGPNIRATSDEKGKFTALEWVGTQSEALDQFVRDAREALSCKVSGKIGSNIVFFEHPVATTYRAENVCQIIPIPAAWPRPGWLRAPHPAIIEFSYSGSPNKDVDRFRRGRIYHRLVSFLSIALKGSMVEVSPNQSIWVIDPCDTQGHGKCLKTGYLGGGDHWMDKDGHGFSLTNASPCPIVPAQEYYQRDPRFDHEFETPDNLDSNLLRFLDLPQDRGQRFMRAAHWFRVSKATLSISVTAAVNGLFSAFDALVGPPPPATNRCNCCGRGQQPSASQRFDHFLNEHADLDTLANKKEILRIYSSSRNGFVHGGKVSAFEGVPFDNGFSELQSRDMKIYHHVRHMLQIATLNWLQTGDEAAK